LSDEKFRFKAEISSLNPARLSAKFAKLSRPGPIGSIATSWTAISSTTFVGPMVVEVVRKQTKLPLDVHLMIEHADHYVPRFVDAGANSITVHVEPEARHDVGKTLQQIRDAGCRAGLTLNPATSFDLLEPFLDKIDILLVMTVILDSAANHSAPSKWKK